MPPNFRANLSANFFAFRLKIMCECVHIDPNFSLSKRKRFIGYLDALGIQYTLADEPSLDVTFIITKKSRMTLFKRYRCTKFTPVAVRELAEQRLGIARLVWERRKVFNLFLREKRLYVSAGVDDVDRVAKQVRRCCGTVVSGTGERADYIICANSETPQAAWRRMGCPVVRQGWLEELETSSFYIAPDGFTVALPVVPKRSATATLACSQPRPTGHAADAGSVRRRRRRVVAAGDAGLRQLKINDFSTASSQKSQDGSSQSSQCSQAGRRAASQKALSAKGGEGVARRARNSAGLSQSAAGGAAQGPKCVDILSYFPKEEENTDDNVQKLCQEILDANECNVPFMQNYNDSFVKKINLNELNDFSQREVKEYQDIVEYPHGNEIDIQTD